MAGLLFREEKCLEVRPETIQRGFLSERKGKVVPCREAENGKCVRLCTKECVSA